jgi:hypothetical protein
MGISVKHLVILAVVMRVSTAAYASSLVEISSMKALSGTNAGLALSGTTVAAGAFDSRTRALTGTLMDSEITGATMDLATYIENGYNGQSVPMVSRWTWATSIPEPPTLALFGTGVLSLGGVIRRKRV